jgi:glycosyltransferase involved in cell wall biosynthesis
MNPAGLKRVAIIYPYLAHYREAVFEMLSRSDAKHRYVIFSDRESNLPALATIPVEKARSLNPEGNLNWRLIRNRWLTEHVLWQSDALRIATSREFDVVVFLGSVRYLSTWTAAILARLTGKRVLMWTHGVLRPEVGLHGLVRRIFYRLAHGLLLYGFRARDLLAARGFAEDRLYVVFNSLDTAAQLRALQAQDAEAPVRARRTFGIPDKAHLLLSIGRLVDGKELDLLPPAVAQLRASGHDVHLLFVGGGPARAAIERQVADLDLQRFVHFAGEIYSESQLCPLIASSDICVSPGGVGLTAMHALVYGTPVITHDDLNEQKPEFEVIQSGVTGAFFRRGDAADLAATIGKWLASGRDRDAQRTLCQEFLLQSYTPENQRELIDNAVDGVPANVQRRPAQLAVSGGAIRDAADPLGLRSGTMHPQGAGASMADPQRS